MRERLQGSSRPSYEVAEALIEALVEATAVTVFDRRGGIEIDLRAISAHPHLPERVAVAIGSAVADVSPIDLVCPASPTSLPIAALFSTLYGVGMVSKEGRMGDGSSAAGRSCLVIHDVLGSTSVDSVMATVEDLRAAGTEVLDVAALFDREEGGGEVLLKHGIRFHSAITWETLCGFLTNCGLLRNDFATPRKESDLRGKAVEGGDAGCDEQLMMKTPENHDVVPRKYFPGQSVRDSLDAEMIDREDENCGSFPPTEALTADPSFVSESCSGERLEADQPASLPRELDIGGLDSVKLGGFAALVTAFAESVRFPLESGNFVSSGKCPENCAMQTDEDVGTAETNADDPVFQTPERRGEGSQSDFGDVAPEQRQKRKLGFGDEDSQCQRRFYVGESSSAGQAVCPNVQADRETEFAQALTPETSIDADRRKRPWEESESSDAEDMELLSIEVAGSAYSASNRHTAANSSAPAAGAAARPALYNRAGSRGTYRSVGRPTPHGSQAGAAARARRGSGIGNSARISIAQGGQAATRTSSYNGAGMLQLYRSVQGASSSNATSVFSLGLSAGISTQATTGYTITATDRRAATGARELAYGVNAGLDPNSLRSIMQNLTTTADANAEAIVDDGLMTVQLFKHQRIALAWMIYCENRKHYSGGFLADDQGLGKTVSAIALILKSRSRRQLRLLDSQHASSQTQNELADVKPDVKPEVKPEVKREVKPEVKPEVKREVKREVDVRSNVKLEVKPNVKPGGTLIVCPTSVLRQWAHEIETKVADPARLSKLIYHGSNRETRASELAKYDIVLTTYAIVRNEVPGPARDEEDADSDSDSDDDDDVGQSSLLALTTATTTSETLPKKRGGPLAEVSWFRVVLDEAQNVKNAKTAAATACWGLKSDKRWCLSGTPIQNSIDDLFSYFRFLRFSPFDNYTNFKEKLRNPIYTDAEREEGYRRLSEVLRTIMLRRTKDTMIDGEPILRLPPKHITLHTLDFAATEERKLYDELDRRSRQIFKAYEENGTVKRNYFNILAMLLRMRQACSHPFLATKNGEYEIAGDSQNSSVCSICSDVPEQPVQSTACGHVFCKQCVSDQILTTTESVTECPFPGCSAQLNNSVIVPLATAPVVKRRQCEEGSTKINALMELLSGLPVVEPAAAGSKAVTEKALVFSQWTSFLDLLEPHLKKAGLKFRRLDGTMTVKKRDAGIREFNEDPEISVMLISLKAGSVGLNMVAASHVFLMDLWWNPTVEDQAIDRTHRIGQTRPVHVWRLTVKDTIEDRILGLQGKWFPVHLERRMEGSVRGISSVLRICGSCLQFSKRIYPAWNLVFASSCWSSQPALTLYPGFE